jgi:RHS repeat-associated protein
MGRTVLVTAPGGAVSRLGYKANETWSRDAANLWKRTKVDGFGRIVEVEENPVVTDTALMGTLVNPADAQNPATLTTYNYNLLDNLTGVMQGGQSRSYTYNSLSWLLTANNPETGAIQYDYDSNGNLTYRSDLRGASVTIGYDRWNRPLSKTYTNGEAAATSNVSFTYDVHPVPLTPSYPKGQLTEVAVAGGTVRRNTQFDALGRVMKSSQTTGGTTYNFEYTFNALGALETEKYQSGRTVSTCYDVAGRVKAVKNGGVTSTDIYAQIESGPDPESGTTVAGYHPMGGMQRLLLQNGTMAERWNYNERGQTQLLGIYKTPAGGPNSPLMKLTLGYGLDTENNGNLRNQVITLGSFAATQNYDYDRWSRLKIAQEGTNWRQEFGYDQWGNRWMLTGGTSGFSVPAGTPTGSTWYSTATNRVLYPEDSNADPNDDKTDKAGNQSFNGNWRNRYDVENRIARVELPTNPPTVAGSYDYDGEGRRVMKTVGSAVTTYVYDAMGELMQEVQQGGAAEPAGRSYLFQDHLGSTRLRVDSSGTRLGWWDYAPFGEVVPGTLGGRSGVANAAYEGLRPQMMFTGKERDAETGLDYFGARYFASSQGRMTSPDAPFADQHTADPQSWNLYAYVRNSPLRFIDPTGRTLTASQGWSDMQGDLCSILGAPDCANRISRDQKTGAVSIDFDGIDLSKNEGAQLLSDLISSGNTYDLSYGSSLQTSGRVINVTFLENLDRKADWRYGKGKTPEDQPRAGVDGQVAFNWPNITIKPNPLDPQSVPGSGSAPALRWTTVFHELAESYAKVDKGMQYMDRSNPSVGAHWNAVDRERAMRGQRPYLRLFQFGSGGGTNWQPTTRMKR